MKRPSLPRSSLPCSSLPRPADILLLIGLNVLWGSTYTVAQLAMATMPPLVLAFLRYALAAAWMFACGSHRDAPAEKRANAGRERWLLAVIGVVGFGLAKVLLYEGLRRSTATDAALIINLEAVFTALLGVWLLGQRLAGIHWVGLLIAFAGGVLLVWPVGEPAHAAHRALGNLLMVGSVAAEAAASVLGVRAMQRYTGLQVTAYGAYWGAAVLLPAGSWQWAASGYTTSFLTGPNIALLVFLALAATVLAYSLWFRTLERVEAGHVAVFLYVQPLVGLFLGIGLLHQLPTPPGVVGGLLVVFGIILASRPSSSAESPGD